MEYYRLLEKLVQTTSGKANQTSFRDILDDLMGPLRISHGATFFYPSLTHEKLGQGEALYIGEPPRSKGRAPSGAGISPAIGPGGAFPGNDLTATDGATLGQDPELFYATDKIFTKRTVAGGQTVVISTVWHDEAAEPWTREDLEHILTTTEVVQSYLIRSRLQTIAEHLTIYDSDEYPNLRYFFNCLETFSESDDLRGKAALHINLKHFALVNKQIGRKSGDIVMRSFFDRLSGLVGEGGVACRVISDNFVALCGTDALEAVLSFLKGVPVMYDYTTGSRVMVSATAGVFIIPDGFLFEHPSDIMDRIIAASNKAKYSTKDEVVYYDHNFSVNREKLNRMQNLFPNALRSEEFKVYYQPKVNIDTCELAGAEALCRWYHAGDIVQPGDFIPILEQTGDICRLDYYMLEHVCQDLRQWIDKGCNIVRVSVNFSRAHMVNLDLCRHILDIVDRYQIPHQYIEIELTETTTDVDFRDLKRVVRDLQLAGLHTTVDDFGTGYSSLNLIKEIPWNALKLDRSFLPSGSEAKGNSRDVMFHSVTAMASGLGLECVAEGVETRAQVEVLRRNGCRMAQGFFFDRPLPKADFEKRLIDHKYNIYNITE